jgi:hypothetical protein
VKIPLNGYVPVLLIVTVQFVNDAVSVDAVIPSALSLMQTCPGSPTDPEQAPAA